MITQTFKSLMIDIAVGNIPLLDPKRIYTLKEILGEKAWALLNVVEKRLAGKLFLEIVKKNDLPLIFCKLLSNKSAAYCVAS